MYKKLPVFLTVFVILFSGQLVAQIPQTPYLISPPNGATDVSLTPTLDWSTVVPNVTYRLHIESSAPGDVRVYTTDVSSKTIEGCFLRNEVTYKWRVKAENNYGESDWTDWWFFTCAPLGTPQLIYPPHWAIGVSITPTLSWTETTGTLKYEIVVVEEAHEPDVFKYGDITGTSFTVGPLKYNTTYSWHVGAIGFPFQNVAG